MKRFSLHHDPIRRGDLYRVTRRGSSVHVGFFASAGTIGQWGRSVQDALVHGFAMYDGEPVGQYDLKLLQMVERAICKGMGYSEYPLPVSESADYELADSMREKRRLLREFIAEHLEALQDVDDVDDA
jgi:hypothetical protein